MDQWHYWVERLANAEPPPRAFNPYALSGGSNCAVRRHNLQVYLREMARLQPRMMLVGEALGYRGARVTGVPFTSRRLLRQHPWYAMRAFRAVSGEFAEGEATATIVQNTLDALAVRPLLWNAYPLHPHQRERPFSNRKPSVGELRIGQPFLIDLLERFNIVRVVALGNSAADSLRRLGIDHVKVRHPSQGGKRDFVAGLQRLISR